MDSAALLSDENTMKQPNPGEQTLGQAALSSKWFDRQVLRNKSYYLPQGKI